jgi:hypothetical protein
VKAVKAPDTGHEDSNGNNDEVSREKNGQNKVEKQTKLPIAPSKNGEQVRILQKWDGQRPYINWILKDFQRYLVQKKIQLKEQQEINCYFSTDWGKAKKLKRDSGLDGLSNARS